MQYVLIALVVVVAVALVAIPFIRAPRGAGRDDFDAPDRHIAAGEAEPRGTDSPDAGPVRHTPVGASVPGAAGVSSEAGLQPSAPAPRTTPEPTVPGPAAPPPPGESGAEELPQAAPPPPAPTRPLGAATPGAPIAAAGRAASTAQARRVPPGDQLVARADTRLEQEILRYREALRAGTICEHCSSANPAGSRFCKECGEKL